MGKQRSQTATSGAFLDFADTNLWKSTQLADFVEAMGRGEVSDTAHILFTDFWNPALLQVAYMRDLLDKKWVIHGIAHAGAYDPSDILGLKMQKPWPWKLEQALYYASDYTYFGTHFHCEMFLRNLEIPLEEQGRAIVSGQPHGKIISHIESIDVPATKARQIIWPHRYNEDKQPEIAEDLATSFDTVITQKLSLNKDEYYKTLADSKVMFSCSLHENLGISIMEGVLLDVIPFIPDRCSYSEMYLEEFKYPSEWTQDYDSYMKHRKDIVKCVQTIIDTPQVWSAAMKEQKKILKDNYLSADTMVRNLTGSSE